MKLFQYHRRLSMLLIALTVLAGCGGNALEGLSDEGSFEARLDTAIIALDDENYAKAVTLLLNLQNDYPDNAEVDAYLSNAYAGLAGLDTFSLLEVLSDLDDLGNSGSIDMIGLTLGNAEGVLDSAEIEVKLDYLDNAIAALEGIAEPNDDQQVQRGLLGVFRTGLILGQTIANDTGQSSVTLTEAGIKETYAGQDDPDFDGDVANDDLISLSDDIESVGDAVDVLDGDAGEENDISEDFLEFKNDMDPNGDNWVSVDEMENYVIDILND